MTSNNLELALKLISVQVEKRRVQLDNDSVFILFKIVNSSSALQPFFMQVVSVVSEWIRLDNDTLNYVANHLLKQKNIDSLSQFLQFVEKKKYALDEQTIQNINNIIEVNTTSKS
ncbi:unnamed protein product [Ambrosiozyma monospora]|uniref:Unnamed protein product n=1 Tax=Ambrosiozyma monospora TaxID=43982 RepID=A0ACB5T878_AMBMO|nr:unnamed protein product [Ambrosiozyma monospora]